MKMDCKSGSRISHEEAHIMLPWYANGTLTSSEQLRVSAHLATCGVCRKELTEFQQLQVHWHTQPAPTIELESGLARLMAKIDGTELSKQSSSGAVGMAAPQPTVNLPRKAAVVRPLRDWLHDVFARRSFALTLASVTGAAVIALVTTRAWQGSEQGNFRTLGLKVSEETADGNDIHIVFSESATLRQVMETVASVNVRILEGPTSNGVFRVRLDAEASRSHEIIDALRGNPLITLVEPAIP